MKKLNSKRQTKNQYALLIAIYLAGFLRPNPGWAEIKPAQTNTSSSEADAVNRSLIKTTLVPDKSTIMLGEPTKLSFVVENASDQDLQVVVGANFRDAHGRSDRFYVTVTGENGLKVVQPNQGPDLGGMMGVQKLPAKGRYVFRLFIPSWARFEKIGNYSIVVQKTLRVSKFNAAQWNILDKMIDIPSQASTRLTVIAQDKEKLGEIIADLGNRTLTETVTGHDSPIQSLDAIDDERTIPYFVKALSTNSYELRFAAITALAKFNNEAAFQSLKKAMTTNGDEVGNTASKEVADQVADNLRVAAAYALSKSPYPGAIPYLITRRSDPAYGVRVTVLHVLGKMSPNEAIPILQEMSHDKNKIVSDEAKRYLQLMNQK